MGPCVITKLHTYFDIYCGSFAQVPYHERDTSCYKPFLFVVSNLQISLNNMNLDVQDHRLNPGAGHQATTRPPRQSHRIQPAQA